LQACHERPQRAELRSTHRERAAGHRRCNDTVRISDLRANLPGIAKPPKTNRPQRTMDL
jgi:hypothetical protein